MTAALNLFLNFEFLMATFLLLFFNKSEMRHHQYIICKDRVQVMKEVGLLLLFFFYKEKEM